MGVQILICEKMQLPRISQDKRQKDKDKSDF